MFGWKLLISISVALIGCLVYKCDLFSNRRMLQKLLEKPLHRIGQLLGSKRSFFFDLPDMSESVVVKPTATHTATVIFLHGLGDTGHGWSPVFQQMIREPYIKYICPHAPVRPVTINMGMNMPAWFDIFGLTLDSQEDEAGIKDSTKTVHDMIEAEIKSGIPSERIMVGGFSMGGALALYSGITYDKKIAGIIGLSAFMIRRNEIPGNHVVNKEIPIFQGHGDSDPLVAPAFAQATAQLLKTFNPNHQMTVYPHMGHSACDKELNEVKQFIAKYLPPQ